MCETCEFKDQAEAMHVALERKTAENRNLRQRIADLEAELDAYPPLATIEGMRGLGVFQQRLADMTENEAHAVQAFKVQEARAERAEAAGKLVVLNLQEREQQLAQALAALRKVEKNAHGGYLMGGSYVNPCGCDRIARSALTPTEEPQRKEESDG